MNRSEDFDVRAEIYQQTQWGRNIKCEPLPAIRRLPSAAGRGMQLQGRD